MVEKPMKFKSSELEKFDFDILIPLYFKIKHKEEKELINNNVLDKKIQEYLDFDFKNDINFVDFEYRANIYTNLFKNIENDLNTKILNQLKNYLYGFELNPEQTGAT